MQIIAGHLLCRNLQTCSRRLFYVQRASNSDWKQGVVHSVSMWQNYFNDVLTTFRALDLSVALRFMEGQRPLDLIKNILICVPKIKEGLMSLERHGVRN